MLLHMILRIYVSMQPVFSFTIFKKYILKKALEVYKLYKANNKQTTEIGEFSNELVFLLFL
jgi:hypothetical protein